MDEHILHRGGVIKDELVGRSEAARAVVVGERRPFVLWNDHVAHLQRLADLSNVNIIKLYNHVKNK